MLCILFLSTLQNESLPSEGNSQVEMRGWGWAACLQSLMNALGLAPGVCAWGHRFCFHLIHQPCSEQGCWWARGYSPAGCRHARGALWLQSWRTAPWQRGNEGGHLEKHLGLLFQYIQGFAYVQGFGLILFQVFALPWDSGHYGSVKFKWKVPVPIWGFSNQKVKWFICPFYLFKVLQYIFTKVSYFMIGRIHVILGMQHLWWVLLLPEKEFIFYWQ